MEVLRIKQILKRMHFTDLDVYGEIDSAILRVQGSGEESDDSELSEDLEAILLQVPQDSCFRSR